MYKWRINQAHHSQPAQQALECVAHIQPFHGQHEYHYPLFELQQNKGEKRLSIFATIRRGVFYYKSTACNKFNALADDFLENQNAIFM